jgi:hypothetical protein
VTNSSSQLYNVEILSRVVSYYMTNTTRAKRASIKVGELELDIFMLPNGDYALSQTQVAEAVGNDEISYRHFLAGKSPQALPYKGFRSDKLAVEGNNRKINVVPIEIAIAFWTKEAIAKNVNAILLLSACAIEAIERRADKVFNQKRTEEEYNERLKARMSGKAARRQLTDSINDYIAKHPELSDNKVKWLYKNTTDRLYKLLFGKIKKVLADELKLEELESFRDHLTVVQLRQLEALEDLMTRLIDHFDIYPLEAAEEASRRYLIK